MTARSYRPVCLAVVGLLIGASAMFTAGSFGGSPSPYPAGRLATTAEQRPSAPADSKVEEAPRAPTAWFAGRARHGAPGPAVLGVLVVGLLVALAVASMRVAERPRPVPVPVRSSGGVGRRAPPAGPLR